MCSPNLVFSLFSGRIWIHKRYLLSCYNITNTIGSFLLTLRWYAFCLVSNVYTPSISAFWTCGAAKLERSIGWEETGLKYLTSNLVVYINYLLTLRKLYSHLCTWNWVSLSNSLKYCLLKVTSFWHLACQSKNQGQCIRCSKDL